MSSSSQPAPSTRPSWPPLLAVSVESLLIQNVTSAVTDTSTRPHHETTVEEGTPAGSVTTTNAMASGARSITTASAGSSRGPTKTLEAQNDGSKHTTFRPLIQSIRFDQSKHHHEHHWGPVFEEPVNVTSGAALSVGYHLSTEAILNYRIGMLQDKSIAESSAIINMSSLLKLEKNHTSADVFSDYNLYLESDNKY